MSKSKVFYLRLIELDPFFVSIEQVFASFMVYLQRNSFSLWTESSGPGSRRVQRDPTAEEAKAMFKVSDERRGLDLGLGQGQGRGGLGRVRELTKPNSSSSLQHLKEAGHKYGNRLKYMKALVIDEVR